MTMEGMFSCKQASHCWPGGGSSSTAPLPLYEKGLSLNTGERMHATMHQSQEEYTIMTDFRQLLVTPMRSIMPPIRWQCSCQTREPGRQTAIGSIGTLPTCMRNVPTSSPSSTTARGRTGWSAQKSSGLRLVRLRDLPRSVISCIPRAPAGPGW